MKMQKKSGGGVGLGGGQGECERRSKVIVKIQKKNMSGGQVRSGIGGGWARGWGWSWGRGLVGSKVGGRG